MLDYLLALIGYLLYGILDYLHPLLSGIHRVFLWGHHGG